MLLSTKKNWATPAVQAPMPTHRLIPSECDARNALAISSQTHLVLQQTPVNATLPTNLSCNLDAGILMSR